MLLQSLAAAQPTLATFVAPANGADLRPVRTDPPSAQPASVEFAPRSAPTPTEPEPGSDGAPEGANLDLRLDVDPLWAAPGEVVTFTVTARNPAPDILPALVLTDTLPEGLLYVAHSAQGFDYDAAAKRLSWAAGDLAVGQVITGSFHLRVQGVGIGATVTNTVCAAGPTSGAPARASADLDIAPPANGIAVPLDDGSVILRAPNDKLLLRLQDTVGSAAARVVYSPDKLDDDSLPGAELAFRLQITGHDAPTLLMWPVQLKVRRGLVTEHATPALYTRNDTTQAWQRITTNRGRNTLSAEVAADTLYALAPTGTEVLSEPMSQIRGATTSLFSRSITFPYQFDLPPGVAGHTPTIGLTYSSAEHMNQQGHYSYAGHGWEMLGADYVYREPLPENPGYGAITLHLGGRVYTLKWTVPDGKLYAEEDPLLKIDSKEDINNYSADPTTKLVKFRVRTGDGIEYHFGGEWGVDNVVSPKVYFWGKCNEPLGNPAAWYAYAWSRVPLTDIFDQYHNRIKLTWQEEKGEYGIQAADRDVRPLCEPSANHGYVRAIRLVSVEYGKFSDDGTARSKVDFNYESDRWDRPVRYTDQRYGWSFFTIYHLSSARVSVVLPDQTTPTVIRTYTLEPDPQKGYEYQKDVLNLLSITDTTSTLSEKTSFEYNESYLTNYNDYGSLKKVSNQYGGSVEFVSESEGSGAWAKVKNRIERDATTGLTGTWTYSGIDWNADAHGYKTVWVTAPNSATSSSSCEIHEFKQEKPYVGREHRVTTCISCDGNGGCTEEQARHVTTWNNTSEALPLGGYSGNNPQPQFVFVEKTEDYELGIPIKKTVYNYYKERQQGSLSGNKQFGNVTEMEEYGSGTGGVAFAPSPLRITNTWYRPNEGSWLINRPARALVTRADGYPLAETRTYYDGNARTNWDQPPAQPRATRIETMNLVAGQSATNPASISQTYEYADDGNLNWARDALGNTTHYYYDSWFRAFKVCEENAAGQRQRSSLFGVGGEATCAVPAGSSSPLAGRFGQPERTWDANDVATQYGRDDRGRLTQEARSGDTINLPTTTWVYTGTAPFGIETWQREISGSANAVWPVFRYYDGFGRLIQERTETVDGGQQSVTNIAYDPAGREAKRFVPQFETFTRAYVPPPNPNPQLGTATYYDALGRVTKVVAPDNTSTETFYRVEYSQATPQDPDFLAPLSSVYVVDAKRHFTRQSSDAFGRLRFVSAATGFWPVDATVPTWGTEYRNRYSYDELDHLVTAVDASKQATTTLTYDGFGRKSSMTDADMGRWEYSYDDAGNLVSQRDARNQSTYFYHDKLNRLIAKAYASGTNCPNDLASCAVSYGYDDTAAGNAGKGRRTSMTRTGVGANSVLWAYDSRGRVSRETRTVDGRDFSTAYTYRANDQVATTTYPDGEVVTTGYESRGLPRDLSSPLTTYVSGTSYDAAGRLLTQMLNPSQGAIPVERAYFPWSAANGRLQRLSAASALDLTYSYDAVGNVATLQDATNANQKQCFTYDALDRLTKATTFDDAAQGCIPDIGAANYAQSFAYLPNGNIEQLSGQSSEQGSYPSTYSYEYQYGATASNCSTSQAAKPHAVATTVVNTGVLSGTIRSAYTYDCNGNVHERREDGQTFQQSWDEENRLARVTGGGHDVEYTYDADGQLAMRVDLDGAKTLYVGPHFEVYIDASPTATATPSRTATPSPTLTGATATASVTPARTPTPSLTPTRTATGTASATPSPSATPTSTATATPGGGGTLDLTPSADAYLARWSATTNYGNSTALNVRYGGANEEFSALLRFGLGGIPANASITGAQLILTVTNSPASWLDLDVFAVQRAWVENTVTWNLADSGVSWSAAGCNGAGTDRAATAALSTRVPQTPAGGTVTLNLPASLISGWLADPATNQGLLLRPKSNTGGAILTFTFASSEHATSAYRPKLSITYTLPGGRSQPDAVLAAAPPLNLAASAELTAVPAGQRWRSYYFLGGQRIAMRERTGASAGVVNYLLNDHLGSTSAVVDATSGQVARQRYYPYGAPRPSATTLPTDRGFTGQRSEEGTLGSLVDFGARPYSPSLGRFLAPDSIVPDPANPQSLNRYAYALNQPLRYVDPSGHAWIDASEGAGASGTGSWAGALASTARTGQEYSQIRTMLVSAALAVGVGGFVVPKLGGLVAEAVTGAATAACSDGDCTNEVRATGQVLRNARTSANVVQNVLTKVDPGRFNAQARFGRAFYAAEEGETAVAEVAAHDAQATHVIRYQVDISQAKVLDLTNANIAKAWGYAEDASAYGAHQDLARKAIEQGYNTIKYFSYRGPGADYAFLDNPLNPFDFDKWLIPQMVSPVP